MLLADADHPEKSAVAGQAPSAMGRTPAAVGRWWVPVSLAVAAIFLAVTMSSYTWALLAGAVAVLIVGRRTLLNDLGLIVAFVAVVMLVPIRVYVLPLHLSYQAAPFRALLVVLGGVVLWRFLFRSLRIVPLPYLGFSVFFFSALLLSDAVNIKTVGSLGVQGEVLGGLGNIVAFIAVFAVVRTLVNDRRSADGVLGSLVLGGGLVGLGAAYEHQSSYNIFDHLNTFLPFLQKVMDRTANIRDGGVRAVASSQHPIALGVTMVMLLPIGLYLARRATWPSPLWRPIYGVAAACIALGVAASASRTTIAMLAVMTMLCLWLRPRLVLFKLLPAVLVVGFLVQSVLLPGAVSQIVRAFHPAGGLLAEQTGQAGTTGGGRLGDLPTVSAEVSKHPLAGRGFATTVVSGGHPDALILDDMYLGDLTDAGLVGFVALVLLWLPPLVFLVRLARRSSGDSDESFADLGVACAASVLGLAVSLALFDGFAFMQVGLVFFLLLAVVSWARTATTKKLPVGLDLTQAVRTLDVSARHQ